MTEETTTPWLDEREARAWMAFRQMCLLVNAGIYRDLAKQSGLSEPDYDVLSSVSESPGARRRLTSLAEHMQWSSSRLSHHISRMQQRGLVTREDVDGDGRGCEIVLTEAGMLALEAAAPGHVASVRRHFIDLMTQEQVEAFAEIGDQTLAPFRRA